ncbi:MAG: hypothetical protein JSW28_10470 [Thermoplasmata archaeon]|nr:MAG: hypothetical protein JSW28_10470 [Thermoplasmata archaeon]
MSRKAISISVTALMIGTLFTVILTGTVSAMNDDQNISGLVWTSDGTAPPSITEFAIWVNHSGVWYRFPDVNAGEAPAYTSMDTGGTVSWYGFVLPDKYQGTGPGSRWDHGDEFRVQVDGTDWGDINANATSNATFPTPSGDPDPTDPTYIYDPTIVAYTFNIINYTAGGGFANEQQWDIRTTAPIDLAPTDVKVEGEDPDTYDPFGVPVAPETVITITFNVTNFGSLGSGGFNISLFNCTPDGQPWGPSPTFRMIYVPGVSGNSVYVVIPVTWFSPPDAGDYYINISVDHYGEIKEYDESNNWKIVHFLIGPDLAPVNVLVGGVAPTATDPIHVGPGDTVTINANAENGGNSPIGIETTMALYRTLGLNGPQTGPSDDRLIPDLNASEISAQQTYLWIAPWSQGDYYVNISVDHYDVASEASETNNHYVLHFVVAPDLWIQIVKVDGDEVTDLSGNQAQKIVVAPLDSITIAVSANNSGPSSTGIQDFSFTYTNCSSTGDPGLNTSFFYSPAVGPILPLETSQYVEFNWTAPSTTEILDYYIRIDVDVGNNVSETNESNNFFVLHINMDAPDLTPGTVQVLVAGTQVDFYPDPAGVGFLSNIIDIPVYEDVTIVIDVSNIGGIASDPTDVTFYNISGLGQPANATAFSVDSLPAIPGLGSAPASDIWPNPGPGGMNITWFINISIDPSNNVLELNESNNMFTLRFNLTPIPVTILNVGDPKLDYWGNGSVFYIKSTTLLNFTVVGLYPPFITWYKITNLDTGLLEKDWTNYTDEGTPNFPISGGEGTYRIEYNSTDSVGGEEATKSRIVIVDDSPPETDIAVGIPQYRAVPTDYLNVTSATLFTLTPEDHPLFDSPIGVPKASGIDHGTKPISGIFYKITRAGTLLVDWTEGSTFALDNASWFDALYLIEYNSTDNLGNEEPTDSITVFLDNTGPATLIAVGTPQHTAGGVLYVKSTTQFDLSGDDGAGCGVNISTIRFRIQNVDTGNQSPAWILGTSFDIAINYTYFAQEGDGNYTLLFYSADYLGNTGNTFSQNIYVDDTAPFVTLRVSLPSYRANSTHMWNVSSDTQISLRSVDGVGSGVASTEYHVYNATYDSGWDVYSPFTLAGLGDGVYVVEYRSTDNLGNFRLGNESLYLDNTTPVTEVIIGDPQYPTVDVPILNITSATVIELNASDLGTGVNWTKYQIYDEFGFVVQADYTDPFTLAGYLDGEYTIYYQSEDMVGNLELLKVVELYLDNEGPTTQIIGGQDDYNTEQNAYNVEFSTFFTLQADDGPGSGPDVIEYRIRIDAVNWTDWTTYTSAFNLTLEDHGYWGHRIEFRSYDNLGNLGETSWLDIYIEGDLIPPKPPFLRVYVRGSDILLDWDPSPDPDIDHYLIYMSTTKTGFDLSTHWVDTSEDIDNQLEPVPLRTQWNHTGAVLGAPEYYYTIRGVDGRGNIGYTSNIGGKVTMTFDSGYNTFALPLTPFEDISAVDVLSSDVFADPGDTVFRYDAGSQQWMGRPKFLPSDMDDFPLEMGEGYMMYVEEDQVQYTFTGAAATSLRYLGGVGNESTFRESLSVSVSGSTVTLNWQPATETDATGYAVYRGTARTGDGSLSDFSLEPIADIQDASTTQYIDNQATGDEYYYMVVAKAHDIEGSSTYSIGVRTYQLKVGYSLISLEMQPDIDDPTLAHYIDDMGTKAANTLYYYDKNSEAWQGHPRFIPDNMNNADVEPGTAYMVYIYDQDVSLSFTGR